MLVVLLLLPLSLAMDDGEFDHGGGGGSLAAAAVVSHGNGQQFAVKTASNESVDGRMMACNDKRGWQTTTKQPTNNGRSKGGWWWWR